MAKVIQKITSGSIQLSPHFYLSEFTDSDMAVRKGINNTPDPLAVQNLFRLAALMEQVRKLLGDRVVSISSGFRNPAVNQAVGGSKTSNHMRGEACDFSCRSFGTPLQVVQAIAKSSIKFGQVIQEGNWVHLSLPDGVNDGEVLTAHFTTTNGKTTATYTRGL
jgi:zinc D-Ala-D-Ala carboxypeptidase